MKCKRINKINQIRSVKSEILARLFGYWLITEILCPPKAPVTITTLTIKGGKRRSEVGGRKSEVGRQPATLTAGKRSEIRRIQLYPFLLKAILDKPSKGRG